MIGVDLFAGAGGMSVGARMAGITITKAVELDPRASSTFEANHPEANLFIGDIRKFELPEIDRGDQQLVLFGGPPCQGFSTSNQRTRGKKNPSNWLFGEFLRIVRTCRPDWVVFENVRGILETENGYFVEQIIKEFESLDYSTNHKVLCSTDYGVPQRRSRFFLVCSLHHQKFEFPKRFSIPAPTVEDAISDLPELDNGANQELMLYKSDAKTDYARKLREKCSKSNNHLVTRNSELVIERFKHVPQGGNWENIPETLMSNYKDRNRCHTGIYHRLKADEPSVVIGNYRKNMLIHPVQHRGLSVREAARLQSFPDSFVFKGSIGFQQQQVGNAVPPLLAKAVFDEVIRYQDSKVIKSGESL